MLEGSTVRVRLVAAAAGVNEFAEGKINEHPGEIGRVLIPGKKNKNTSEVWGRSMLSHYLPARQLRSRRCTGRRGADFVHSFPRNSRGHLVWPKKRRGLLNAFHHAGEGLGYIAQEKSALISTFAGACGARSIF